MKKSISNFLGTVLLTILLSFFMPWWSVMVAAFATALFLPLKKFSVFVIPFLAIFSLWFVYSYILSSHNDFILAKKIAILLPLEGNPYLLISVSALIGGIAAGTAAILGKQCSVLLNKK